MEMGTFWSLNFFYLFPNEDGVYSDGDFA